MNKTVTKQKALMEKFKAAGDLVNAKKVGMLLVKSTPNDASVYTELAHCDFHLRNPRDAIRWGLKAISLDPHNLPALIAVSNAYGALDDVEQASKYGRMVLEMRDRAIPELASGQPRTPRAGGTKKLIAFSLFGGSSKYCETAVINAQRQPALYPGWITRYYVDASVPSAVKERLEAAGAQVENVDGPISHWPGPMWRFAACDDPEASHVLFRDADAIISEREAGAVREWMESGRHFHVMRDAPTHTSLILAGMWGMRTGALPEIKAMVADFLDRRCPGWRQQPVATDFHTRALDQRFLAIHVWPYARGNMLQHDSVFAFCEHRPFPDGPRHSRENVGNCESSAHLRIAVEGRDADRVTWKIFSIEDGGETLVCAYDDVARNGSLHVNIPLEYARKLNEGKMVVRVEP